MGFQDRGYQCDETSVLGNYQLPGCRASYLLTKKNQRVREASGISSQVRAYNFCSSHSV